MKTMTFQQFVGKGSIALKYYCCKNEASVVFKVIAVQKYVDNTFEQFDSFQVGHEGQIGIKVSKGFKCSLVYIGLLDRST